MGSIRIAKDFQDFLRLFLDHEVRFMVIGGYAVVHHSRPRFTGDLDLWVESSPDNAARVIKSLKDFGLRGEDVVPELISEPGQIIRFGFEPMRLEIFTNIPGVDFSECYPRRVFARIAGMDVPFISLEDLKINKRASGRHKDLQDLEELP
jgi:predicted nucleotidyltransferase